MSFTRDIGPPNKTAADRYVLYLAFQFVCGHERVETVVNTAKKYLEVPYLQDNFLAWKHGGNWIKVYENRDTSNGIMSSSFFFLIFIAPGMIYVGTSEEEGNPAWLHINRRYCSSTVSVYGTAAEIKNTNKLMFSAAWYSRRPACDYTAGTLAKTKSGRHDVLILSICCIGYDGPRYAYRIFAHVYSSNKIQHFHFRDLVPVVGEKHNTLLHDEKLVDAYITFRPNTRFVDPDDISSGSSGILFP